MPRTITITDITIVKEYHTWQDEVTGEVFMTMSGSFDNAEGVTITKSVTLGPLTGVMLTRAAAQFTDGKALWKSQEGI